MNARHHPGGRHRARQAHPDPLFLSCPHCDATLLISRRNLKHLLAAGSVAYPGECELALNIAAMPPGDWVAPAAAGAIAAAVAAAVAPAGD